MVLVAICRSLLVLMGWSWSGPGAARAPAGWSGSEGQVLEHRVHGPPHVHGGEGLGQEGHAQVLAGAADVLVAAAGHEDRRQGPHGF